MQRKLKDIGEFGLIKRIAEKEKVFGKEVIVGIGDDSAVIKYKKGYHLLLTTDMLIEGIHFNKKATPFQIGYKSLATNISDIAAMGGIPKYALVSLGLKKETSIKFVDEIYRGIRSLAKKFKVTILGGDTVSSPKIIINIALSGEVKKNYLTLRKGAKPGDKIYVTGTLGGSILGKHLSFIPRVKEARYLVENFHPTSMIDISDGLLSDLKRVCEASKVGARIYQEKIPLSQGVISLAKKKKENPYRLALTGGEEFELLFTLSKKYKNCRGRIHPTRGFITQIGEITKRGIVLLDEKNKVIHLRKIGFDHFKNAGNIS
ncbi:MAG: thiamine-phosphate kinase [Candidatus Omnitrophica bacterium]|nr:thiamine-phosphate kinase [Candidatus Omnitrophota bacterium]